MRLVDIVLLCPRDAMHKRGICRHSVSVRLSVRLSVTFMYYVVLCITSKRKTYS